MMRRRVGLRILLGLFDGFKDLKLGDERFSEMGCDGISWNYLLPCSGFYSLKR